MTMEEIKNETKFHSANKLSEYLKGTKKVLTSLAEACRLTKQELIEKEEKNDSNA